MRFFSGLLGDMIELDDEEDEQQQHQPSSSSSSSSVNPAQPNIGRAVDDDGANMIHLCESQSEAKSSPNSVINGDGIGSSSKLNDDVQKAVDVDDEPECIANGGIGSSSNYENFAITVDMDDGSESDFSVVDNVSIEEQLLLLDLCRVSPKKNRSQPHPPPPPPQYDDVIVLDDSDDEIAAREDKGKQPAIKDVTADIPDVDNEEQRMLLDLYSREHQKNQNPPAPRQDDNVIALEDSDDEFAARVQQEKVPATKDVTPEEYAGFGLYVGDWADDVVSNFSEPEEEPVVRTKVTANDVVPKQSNNERIPLEAKATAGPSSKPGPITSISNRTTNNE
ncbi:hypothetical protein HDU76_011223, partial [Blyttiomyces sp. JEL0837]